MLPLRPGLWNRSSSSANSSDSSSSSRPELSHFSSSNTTSTEESYAPETPLDLPGNPLMASTVVAGMMGVPSKNHGDPAASAYPAYILSLLNALESDPQRLSRSLAAAPASVSIPGDATAQQQQGVENEAILASVARIADKLVKAQQQDTGSQRYAAPTPIPPAGVNNETSSRLSGQNSNSAGGAVTDSNGAQSSVASPPYSGGSSITTSSPDHTSDGFDGQPLSAEKELRLLKAQVQDFARVCKVRTCFSWIFEKLQNKD